jgi:hypothetical protein
LLPEQSQIVFIVGSPGSGKRDFLNDTFLRIDSKEPPVDIVIVPESDGLSLKSRWITGPMSRPEYCNKNPGGFSDVSLNSFKDEELTGNIALPLQNKVPLFQNWAACWRAKNESDAYHPHFLLHGLHALSPEHQGVLLDTILSEGGLSQPTGGPPLFVTITSLPTWTLADKLRHFSGTSIYINLDDMKVDPALLEAIIVTQILEENLPPPRKVSKLARILASSPRLGHHLETIRPHLQTLRPHFHAKPPLLPIHDYLQCENCLGIILAGPESEALRLIDEHFGESPPDV